jgi:tRNA threonylcarbamoyladenosine biosynthesis protein TsaB
LRPDLLVLAIDTSAAHCAAALLCGDRVAVRVEEMAKGQAERLVPMVTELLASEGFSMSDVGLIGVGVGPGNFTGIRIAVALARGLALGLGVPAIGVTGFDAARTEGADWVVLPAPRGQVYAQRFLPEPEAALIMEPDEVVGARVAHLQDTPVADFVVAIARLAQARAGVAQPRPAPFYLRGADAAPASDPPPVILP